MITGYPAIALSFTAVLLIFFILYLRYWYQNWTFDREETKRDELRAQKITDQVACIPRCSKKSRTILPGPTSIVLRRFSRASVEGR